MYMLKASNNESMKFRTYDHIWNATQSFVYAFPINNSIIVNTTHKNIAEREIRGKLKVKKTLQSKGIFREKIIAINRIGWREKWRWCNLLKVLTLLFYYQVKQDI
jgi:hypothetical protein